MANLITNITNFADQTAGLQLPDGTSLTLELVYQGATERWIANVTYGTFSTSGVGVCCFPNILRQWRKVIPFGIAVTTADQTDPFNINDFSTGRVLVFLLTSSEVNEIENTVFGGAS